MANSKIKFKTGLKADLPSEAEDGEIFLTTDTNEIYRGKGIGVSIEPASLGYQTNESILSSLSTIESGISQKETKTTSLESQSYEVIPFSLLKTNFKLGALTNATKYSLTNMVVDTLEDGSNIETGTNYIVGSPNSSNVNYQKGWIGGYIDMSGGEDGLRRNDVGSTATLRKTYTTPQGYVVTSQYDTDSTTGTSNSALKHLFNNNYSTTSDSGSWLVGVSSVTGQTLLNMSFNGTLDFFSMDIYHRAYYVSAKHYTRGQLLYLPDGLDDISGNYVIAEQSPDTDDNTTYTNFGGSSWVDGSVNPFSTFYFNEPIQKIKINTLSIASGDEYGLRKIIIIPRTSSVTFNTENVSVPPKKVILISEQENNNGNVSFEISFDNGTSYQSITPDTLLNVTTTGTQIKLKANITNDARLNAYALAWA